MCSTAAPLAFQAGFYLIKNSYFIRIPLVVLRFADLHVPGVMRRLGCNYTRVESRSCARCVFLSYKEENLSVHAPFKEHLLPSLPGEGGFFQKDAIRQACSGGEQNDGKQQAWRTSKHLQDSSPLKSGGIQRAQKSITIFGRFGDTLIFPLTTNLISLSFVFSFHLPA